MRVELDREPFAGCVVIDASLGCDDTSLDRYRQLFYGSKYGFFAGRELDSIHANASRGPEVFERLMEVKRF
jgi:hypothetical protein